MLLMLLLKVAAVAVSAADGESLLSAGGGASDLALRVWQAPYAAPTREFARAHAQPLVDACWAPESRDVAHSVALDRMLGVWDCRAADADGCALALTVGSGADALPTCVAPWGEQRAVVGTAGGAVCGFDLRAPGAALFAREAVGIGGVTGLAVRGEQLLASDNSGRLVSLTGDAAATSAVVFSASAPLHAPVFLDDSRCLVACWDGEVRTVTLQTAE